MDTKRIALLVAVIVTGCNKSGYKPDQDQVDWPVGVMVHQYWTDHPNGRLIQTDTTYESIKPGHNFAIADNWINWTECPVRIYDSVTNKSIPYWERNLSYYK